MMIKQRMDATHSLSPGIKKNVKTCHLSYFFIINYIVLYDTVL